MRKLLPAPTAHAWSQLSEISGRISGRISGLAGYRISGRISGNAYPVSGRIPDIKKWPDIRHIPSFQWFFWTNLSTAINIVQILTNFYSKLKLLHIISTRLFQESNSQRKYLCSKTWPDIRPDIWLSRILDIRPDIRQRISGIRLDTGYQKMAGYPVSRISSTSLICCIVSPLACPKFSFWCILFK